MTDEGPTSASRLRFVRPVNQVIGVGQHRSGWPYAVGCLKPLESDAGILFDDFVEHRFCYRSNVPPYREPWIGVFHHPPCLPPFASEGERLSLLFTKPVWKESARYLLGAIALSHYLADYLSDALHVPVAVVKHPSEIPDERWSETAYLANSYKWLLQVGWYLRNTRIAFQVPPLPCHRKVRLWPPPRPPLDWVREYDERVAQYWQANNTRREWDDVTNYPLVPPDTYDRLLASHVVLTEVFDASANNVVIECLVRNTPIVVNRHPAVVEYLGPDYPLFFQDVREIPALLDDDRVVAAHRHLKSLDKSSFGGDAFRQAIAGAVQFITGQSVKNCSWAP